MAASDNKAQDLLSAALDESGLGLDLGEFTGMQNAVKPELKFNVRVVPPPHQNHVGVVARTTIVRTDQNISKNNATTVGFVPNNQPFPFGGFGDNLTPRHTLPTLVELNKLSVMSKMAQVGLGSSSAIHDALSRTTPKLKSNGSNDHHPVVTNKLQSPLTGKELFKLWSNVEGTSKMKQNAEKSKIPADVDIEEEDDEDDELGQAETYAIYMPSKLKIGEKHPDPVVETNSLSSVPPPDVWYRLSIPEEVIDYNYLSALQLEAIVYSSQQHEQLLPDGSRAAFLIGDGAGVGKGRTIAGIIYENYILGRKRAIWVSVSNDLKYDAQRDLKDIGAGKIDVHSLNKFKYAKISSKTNGSVKKGVVFATYSSLIGESQSGGKYKTRLKQLLHWCGEKFDGVIVFDECHKAKNLCPVGSSKPTKTGLTVLELQNRLPKARVVYASATGASEPRNMAYMTRLGLWGSGTPFPEFNDFIQSVEKRGVGAMEIVAMDMKLRGMYIARQLSFAGVTFKIEEIPLSKDFIRVYDDSVLLWVSAREKFQKAVELIDAEQRMRKTMWGQFWSAHQRFFKYLCIASKVRHAVKLAREAVKIGKCVVIGLQSTGEARTLEQLEEAGGELNDFVSTAKGVFQTLVERHFPAPDRRRVHKLLGIESLLELSWSPSATTSQGKRKAERKATLGAKRYKEDFQSGDDDNAKGQDSDFIVSESNDEEDSDVSSDLESDSEVDSDFNPFGDGSDSGDDPWLNRNKKSKSAVSKAGKKKRKRKMKVKRKKKASPASTAAKNGKGTLPLTFNGKDSYGSAVEPPQDAIERACVMKEELLDGLEQIGDKLPPNTLDQLIDELGGPENVAEMTGRKGRIVSNDDGTIQYESRCEVDVPLETMNLTEKQRFMDGDKHIAIISEAASSGISLQSDRRAKNQRRRVHLTLELPWSADRAVQQFGRTHRSNQVNAPEYLFLISDLAGERRFASIVAKRLESLVSLMYGSGQRTGGALTHGDRRATESRDLSRFNIDNRYGRAALDAVMKAVMGLEPPLIAPPNDYDGDFFTDIKSALVGVGLVIQDERYPSNQTLDKDYNNISKFLNRILGMRVELQNRLFKYFTDTLNSIISQAKKAGRFDLGIMDLGTAGDQVKRIRCDVFITKHATGVGKIELHTVSIERGMTWNQALDIWSELIGSDEGFYLTNQANNANVKCTAILAVSSATASRKKDKREKTEKTFSVYRPNTGLQKKLEPIADIKKKYRKVVPDEAQPFWQDQYDKATVSCTHAYWRGSCKRATLGLPCDVGLRRKSYHILSGSVLNVWTKVEAVLTSVPGGFQAKMQVIRLKTEDGLRIVGTVIPLNCYAPLVKVLAQDATKNYTEAF